MFAAEEGGVTTKHAPALSLTDIRSVVGKLSSNHLDILAYIENSDSELCSVAHVQKEHLENYLRRIYERIGINTHLASDQKRKAAALMYKIFDTEGWRPSEDEAALLLWACGKSDEVPPSFVADTQPASPVNGAVVDLVETSSLSLDQCPTVLELIEHMENLSPWRTMFLSWYLEALTPDQMLGRLQEKDKGADASTVQSNVSKLYKALGVRDIHDEPSVRERVQEAYDLFLKSGTSNIAAPVVAVLPPAPSAASVAEVESDLKNIVDRIRFLMKEGQLSPRKIEILDCLLEDQNINVVAERLKTNASNIGVQEGAVRKLFDLPDDPAMSLKQKASMQRALLVEAWKIYRQTQSVEPQDDSGTCKPEPAVSNEKPLGEDSQELASDEMSTGTSLEAEPAPIEVSHLAPDNAEDAVGEGGEQLNEEPQEVVLEDSLLSAPVPEREVLAPSDSLLPAVDQDEAPLAEDELSLQPEVSQPARRVPAPEVVPLNLSGLLSDPKAVQSVRTLWSMSPTFEQEQSDAIAEGYLIESVQHAVTFHPTVQGVSVLVLVKRG